MLKIKLLLLLTGLLTLSSCGAAQSGYPIFLGEGGKITSAYSTFEIKPRIFKDREMISVGIDLEGKVICYGRKSEDRLCSKELKNGYPDYKTPKELIFDPDKKYSDEEIQQQKVKFADWYAKNVKEKMETWYELVDKQPLLDFDVIAVDSNGQDVQLIFAGSGGGYCRSEKDQLCNQFTIDTENGKVKTLDGVTLKAVKIKTVEGELKVSNIYVVGHYQRD